jgi:hypothetical protein
MSAVAGAVTAEPPRSTAEAALVKIPFWGQIQATLYSLAFGQWAVGFWSGVYVLVFQARWFGKSFKYIWDHLNQLWHFNAVPFIGHWLYTSYDVGRHIFLRDAPEAVLAYAAVAMIIPFLATKKRKGKVPLLDKIMVRLGMPSAYQGGMGRHADTSGLQYLFLIPSMIAASLPGEIVMGAVIFGGMAIAHAHGYHSPWLEPTSPWVPVVIGIAGGKFAGHKPAVKAGYDVNQFFIGKRLSLTYAADKILAAFHADEITQDQARNQLTRMRRADPSLLYPAAYRALYEKLLALRVPVRKYTWLSTAVTITVVTVFIIVGGWGVYLRKWGIPHHDFWLPW